MEEKRIADTVETPHVTYQKEECMSIVKYVLTMVKFKAKKIDQTRVQSWLETYKTSALMLDRTEDSAHKGQQVMISSSGQTDKRHDGGQRERNTSALGRDKSAQMTLKISPDNRDQIRLDLYSVGKSPDLVNI